MIELSQVPTLWMKPAPSAKVRATASCLLNLSRSIGASIGISVALALLARGGQMRCRGSSRWGPPPGG